MAESVIADFVGKVNSESTPRGQPIKGRILLSQKRLVLAADDEHTTKIPLTSIFDVAVGHIPPDLGDFFDSTVTIAFERNDRRFVAAIEADDEKIDKFSTVLFKAILNGTQTSVKHPATVGGRVTDAGFERASLYLQPGTVEFRQDGGSIDVKLTEVTGFSREQRTINDAKQPILEVRHMPQGEAVTTLVAVNSNRKLSILGRYLRLEYTELMGDLRNLELDGDETEILVALYSGAGGQGISLASVLDMDASQVTMLLGNLEEAELIVNTEDETKLTPKGQVYVSNHLEDVNN